MPIFAANPCILMKAEKHLEADDNFPHLASAKGGLLRIEDRPPLIYHFSDAEDHGMQSMRAWHFPPIARRFRPSGAF